MNYAQIACKILADVQTWRFVLTKLIFLSRIRYMRAGRAIDRIRSGDRGAAPKLDAMAKLDGVWTLSAG
jgi:hypothetical protein